MVLHRAEKRIEHRRFADFPSYLRQGDLVVLNNTKVIPARLFSDDGRIELLFLEQSAVNVWKSMVKPGRKMKLGGEIIVGGVRGRVIEIFKTGERLIAFDAPVDLDAVGHLPIPPYMERPSDQKDTDRYQTVYARVPGAVAAPTAGLHFDDAMLAALRARGVTLVWLTLHVGAGTFQPVRVEDLAEHAMHSEWFDVPQATVDAIDVAHRAGGKVVAVGTTSMRALESAAANGTLRAGSAETRLFITPGYQFNVVDRLITNFHLPRSTLLMLVSAFGGYQALQRAYSHAVEQRYRFFSYGDAMLIERNNNSR